MTGTAFFTIGSLEIPEAPVDGFGFWFARKTDWDAVTELKNQKDSIPQGHGDFLPSKEWRQAAAPTIVGNFRGVDYVQARDAQEQLRALARDRQLVAFTDRDGQYRSRWVSIDRVVPEDLRGRDRFGFIIDMLAVDPFMYGRPVITVTGLPSSGGGFTWPAVWPADWGSGGDPGQLVTSNPGTQQTWSTFAITGGLAGGFELTASGRRVRFERPVPVGSTVWVEPRTGLAWIDEPQNNVSTYLTVTEWWPVPPGEELVVQFNALGAVTGTPTLTATTSPAYL